MLKEILIFIAYMSTVVGVPSIGIVGAAYLAVPGEEEPEIVVEPESEPEPPRCHVCVTENGYYHVNVQLAGTVREDFYLKGSYVRTYVVLDSSGVDVGSSHAAKAALGCLRLWKMTKDGEVLHEGWE